MLCEYCSKEIRNGASFCPFCGKAVTNEKRKICRKCNREYGKEFFFCDNCGEKLEDLCENTQGDAHEAAENGADTKNSEPVLLRVKATQYKDNGATGASEATGMLSFYDSFFVFSKMFVGSASTLDNILGTNSMQTKPGDENAKLMYNYADISNVVRKTQSGLLPAIVIKFKDGKVTTFAFHGLPYLANQAANIIRLKME